MIDVYTWLCSQPQGPPPTICRPSPTTNAWENPDIGFRPKATIQGAVCDEPGGGNVVGDWMLGVLSYIGTDL
jgi:hypothetical protein